MQLLNGGPPVVSVLLPICRSKALKKKVLMLNLDPPMRSVLLPICPSNACKQQYACWILALPWGQFWYLYFVSMRVKNNTDVEYRPSYGVNFLTHMSLQCVRTVIQIVNIVWGQSCYPFSAPTCVKYNTNVEYWCAHGLSFVTRMSFKGV